MIHMPHRSVTRFFVPLIDVLLLLFCIFLLMPIADEEKLIDAKEKLIEQEGSQIMFKGELDRRIDELKQYEELKPKLQEMAKLQQELQRLKDANRLSLQQRAYFQIIDIDGKKGAISYFDPNAPPEKARIALNNEDAVKALIKRHLQEAGEKREIYYYFLYPRPQTGFPTGGQERQYKKWFGTVANSLRELLP